MSEIFKCMLAVDADLSKLTFPLLASPKLDGIRATVRNNVVYSRSNKPIPNKFIQAKLGKFEHLDGELIVGPANAHNVMQTTMSGVMSEDGEPEFMFYLFDHLRDLNADYVDRLRTLEVKMPKSPYVQLHDQVIIHTLEQLLTYEAQVVNSGYEGLILRSFLGKYKQGRSTVREGYLLKVKRFVDSEALVIGFEERMHNGNEATVSELGRTKRSSHKSGLVGRGDLGALACRTGDGVEFNIGTGFDDDQRAAIWANQAQYLGKFAKFKFFPVGVKEAPRHPVFLGWRDARDM